MNESDATEAIYGIEWESLYTTTGTDGSGADALRSRGVLLRRVGRVRGTHPAIRPLTRRTRA